MPTWFTAAASPPSNGWALSAAAARVREEFDAAPGIALVLIGLLGLVVMRGLGRRG